MRRRITIAATLAVSALALTACSSGGGTTDTGSDGDVKTLSLWDGYTQYNTGDSPFEDLIAACEEQTGITIERTVNDDNGAKLAQGASSGDLPDLTILDNPNVAQYAETGILVDNETSGLDTSAMSANIVASGTIDGKTYGAPYGANTLALFYNKDLLDAAGVQPPTNWDELSAAAQKLTDPAASRYGLAFSARPDAEGTFQFLPFFWGAGAELDDLASPEAVEALTLWSDLVENGSASGENITLNQQDVRDGFVAGNSAMMVNGTWQLNGLDESGINYGVVPIPAKDGGSAAAPLGGEFINLLQSGDDARIAASAEFAACFVEPDNLTGWLEGQTYISPYANQAEEQAASDPRLSAWVEAVSAARSRTEDLGSDYATVAQNLGEAIESAVAGQTSAADALSTAASASE
ncbi:sugar ABC transporter substrate-binding protein [Rathayibacter sp. Leaf248]|uniref:sugar ABC transporter substrate-binding protein n=1 Tax=Rathayibacter sp. Leaf248 TaxID=2876555 RepID=UPI001E4CE46D|nr:extracellular solute-binding protein [Rathayibacter sp. Leaf248]